MVAEQVERSPYVGDAASEPCQVAAGHPVHERGVDVEQPAGPP